MIELACFILLVSVMAHSLNRLRQSKETRSLLYLMVLHITTGTTFFMVDQGLNMINAFYFSVVTMASVGFGDIHPETNIGKIFAALYIISSLGIFSQFALLLSERERK